MIDRITFYIDKVDLEDVEERLSLLPAGVAKDESTRYAGKLRNLSIIYAGERLQISGSLHKFMKGNNYSLFAYKEVKSALAILEKYVGITLDRFIVTQLELGVNFQMANEVEKYFPLFHSYKKHPFFYMAPLKGTSKLRGCKCAMTDYTIKFYDKTFEVIRSGRIPKKDHAMIPHNIMRYEISITRKQLKYEGLKNVTGENLLSDLHYTKFKKLMNRIFGDIVLKDLTINYSLLPEKQIKNYIFALSDGNDRYLEYLKEYRGEKEYRKERRRTNELLKRISPFLKGEFESELKSKFKLAMSEI